jgi:hypothetical protein
LHHAAIGVNFKNKINMDEKLKDQDVLLVKEQNSNELKVVAGINPENGKMETLSPKPENQPDFMKIDKHGNVLDNFFENFKRQFKDPTHFLFFKAPVDKVEETANNLQTALKNPETPQNKEFLDMHRVKPDAQKSHAIHPDLVDWDKFERYGINRERLEKSGNLEKLLDYQKTDLMPVSMKFDDERLYSDARFSLRKQDDGSFAPSVHLIRKEPELERLYFGIKFTDADKENLLKTGNLGRVVNAEFKPGEKTPILLSLDKQTNELVAFRKEWVKVPDAYKGVRLNEEQKQHLGEGKLVRIEDMTSTKGTKFSAGVQFNADKKYFELIFDNDKKQSQNQKQTNEQVNAPKTFRKKELTENQRESLKEGKTVYVDGLEDKKGKKYSGYITLNKENGKSDFMFPGDYKKALADGKVIPDDRHKTQVAVNSEGKTNDATKNTKEPLKEGQTQPTAKQVEKQEEQEKKVVKKSQGPKM